MTNAALVTLIVALGVQACGDSKSRDAAPRASLPDTPTTTPAAEGNETTTTDGSPSPLVSRLTLAIDSDFPDPGVVIEGNVFYAYSTNGDGNNVRLATSTDLTHWTRQPDALPTLPSWAKSNSGLTWAPDVVKLRANAFALYFTARDVASGKQCIGVATATTPKGPFVSSAAAPLVCQTSLGGTIDASYFGASDGRRYLLYKNDGNCCGIATRLFVRELGENGSTFIGQETSVLAATQSWEGGLVEAPAMIESEGFFYLFYSANSYSNRQYASGVARASSPTGPFTKIGTDAFAASDNNKLNGPGGMTPIRHPNGQLYMFFHNWDSNSYRYRSMWIAPLRWENARPVLDLN